MEQFNIERGYINNTLNSLEKKNIIFKKSTRGFDFYATSKNTNVIMEGWNKSYIRLSKSSYPTFSGYSRGNKSAVAVSDYRINSAIRKFNERFEKILELYNYVSSATGNRWKTLFRESSSFSIDKNSIVITDNNDVIVIYYIDKNKKLNSVTIDYDWPNPHIGLTIGYKSPAFISNKVLETIVELPPLSAPLKKYCISPFDNRMIELINSIKLTVDEITIVKYKF